MAVSTTNIEEIYVGDGVEDTFPITFDYLSNDQIVVSLDGVNEPGFTVVNGEVVMTSAPGLGVEVRVYRVTDLTQPTDYDNNAAFPAETHERALDRLLMQIQELEFKVADLITRVQTLETP